MSRNSLYQIGFRPEDDEEYNIPRDPEAKKVRKKVEKARVKKDTSKNLQELLDSLGNNFEYKDSFSRRNQIIISHILDQMKVRTVRKFQKKLNNKMGKQISEDNAFGDKTLRLAKKYVAKIEKKQPKTVHHPLPKTTRKPKRKTVASGNMSKTTTRSTSHPRHTTVRTPPIPKPKTRAVPTSEIPTTRGTSKERTVITTTPSQYLAQLNKYRVTKKKKGYNAHVPEILSLPNRPKLTEHDKKLFESINITDVNIMQFIKGQLNEGTYRVRWKENGSYKTKRRAVNLETFIKEYKEKLTSKSTTTRKLDTQISTEQTRLRQKFSTPLQKLMPNLKPGKYSVLVDPELSKNGGQRAFLIKTNENGNPTFLYDFAISTGVGGIRSRGHGTPTGLFSLSAPVISHLGQRIAAKRPQKDVYGRSGGGCIGTVVYEQNGLERHNANSARRTIYFHGIVPGTGYDFGINRESHGCVAFQSIDSLILAYHLMQNGQELNRDKKDKDTRTFVYTTHIDRRTRKYV